MFLDMRICRKCKIEKRLTEFYKNKQRKDNLTTFCKECFHKIHLKVYSTVKRRLSAQKSKIKCYCGNLISPQAKACRKCFYKMIREKGIILGTPFKKGEKHLNWRGGVTKLRDKIENLKEYRDWRSSVFLRDNYTCKWCGKRTTRGQSVILNADHIKPMSLVIKLNKITDISGALKCKELWDIKNGRTLCYECHKATDTYGYKSHKRCYFEK